MRGSGSFRGMVIVVLLVLLVASIGVAIYSLVQISSRSVEDRMTQSRLSDIQTEIYDLMILANAGGVGSEETLGSIRVAADEIQQLSSAFASSGVELDPASVRQFEALIDNVVARANDLVAYSEELTLLQTGLAELESGITEIQNQYIELTDLLRGVNSANALLSAAQTQLWRSEGLLLGLANVSSMDVDPVAVADQLEVDLAEFSATHNAMLEGSSEMGIPAMPAGEARQALESADQELVAIEAVFPQFRSAVPSLALSDQARTEMFWAGAEILPRAQALSFDIERLPDDMQLRPFSNPSLYLSIAMSVGFLLILGALIFEQTRANLRSQEIYNESNQEAILRLLDEISDLGEGDLTVRATVSEDFTGAIADSINFAVEQLRKLVARVASTAESVAAASSETRATSMRLSEASEHQAEQVTNATNSITDIAGNLAKMSGGAEELAAVAQSSVQIAHSGNKVVHNTIRGMDNIREQIQDTSKRIKRLGESSQEIGDIVSLINEIADQTNILALNASIQAAMAGEAGRGFAVVADEIQGLAERAAASTKQIENLVKAIQSDTNEAVSSMEQTTSEVVRGAQLTNDAGKALSEIQSTSENLARLILAISESANQQSLEANRVSGSMKVIQDISEQTLSGTTETGVAIGELAELAVSLRDSIADFKLPEGMLEMTSDEEEDFPQEFSEASVEETEMLESEVAEAEKPEEEDDALLDEDFLSFNLDSDDEEERS